MARNTRTHLLDDSQASDKSLEPKHLTKVEFARRVYKLMLAKGWNQSELARRADLPRDAVSTYIRGKVFPTPTSLEKLAKALDVSSQDLLPNHAEAAIDADNPSVEMKVSPAMPTKAWLRINRLVSLGCAAKVISLIESDAREAADAEGSGGDPSLL